MREPSRGRAEASQPPRAPDDRPLLRLAMTRGVLGLELDAPFALGPLVIEDIAVSLPDVKFPVDLSGGVAKFRHRRGEIERLAIGAKASAIAAWAAPRLAGLLGPAPPEVVVAPFDGGALVGLRAGAAALAFDVLVAPLEGDLRFIPERARSLGAPSPPHVLALRALSAVIGSSGELVEGAVVVRRAAARLGRELFPSAGARAPGADGVTFGAVTAELMRFELGASRDVDARGAGLELLPRTLRALETCELAGAADARALAGDLDGARDLLLGALERAPRHPEIATRLAWLDLASFGRADAALATLADAIPASFAGVLGGELLRRTGDREGARAAWSRAAHEEPFGAIAGLLWLSVAELADDMRERLLALDQAIARAPGLEIARWSRLEARLDVADARGARADAEHLEAAARGGPKRHAVWQRAAEAFLARGLVAESSELFERSLRYAPDDPVALAGLARALRAAGRHRRAVDLFARASSIIERKGVRVPAVEVELARALAEVAEDRPAAIARVRAVPGDAPERFEALLLEGRWRAEIGDVAGSNVALGRLRAAVEVAANDLGDRAPGVAALLVEAASLSEHADDLAAAQRAIGLALRLRPRDRSIGAAFRRTAAALAARAQVAAPARAAPEPDVHDVHETYAEVASAVDADAEQHLEQLAFRIRADPTDAASAIELATLLDRLERDLDLLALVSARLEEGEEAERARMAPLRVRALTRLAEAAHAAGRPSEAQLYEDMLRGA